VAENGLVSPLSILGFTVGGVIEEVSFNDKVIETAVRQLVNRVDEKVLYTNELWPIRSFTMPEDAQYIDGKRAEERIAQMDKAIKSFDLTEDIKVYRGIDRSALGNIEGLVGKEYIDQAYMSSSIFADNSVLERGDCVMELLIPKGKGRGAYINELSAFKDKEYEFLVARGSKFRVVSVGETNGKPLLRMEMIVDE
jgi:NAD+--asparagine ADP-ribosyltransferase